MSIHYDDGTHIWDGYGGEITVYGCGCGQNFVERSELLEHIKAEQLERQVISDRDRSANT